MKQMCIVHRIAVLIWLFFAFCCEGIVAGNNILPSRLDGRMMPYDFESVEEFSMPDTLTPVRLAYVARHGARYMTGEKKFKTLKDVLSENSGDLSPLGVEMTTLLNKVEELSSGRWGLLSEVGSDEQQELGLELCQMFPDFVAKARINAISTYVPRVIATMFCFTYRVVEDNPDIQLQTAEGHTFDNLLRFFVTDEIYKDYIKEGAWKPIYDKYLSENIPESPARRLFNSDIQRKFNSDKLRTLTFEIYEVLSSLSASGMPQPDDRFMNVGEFEACWKASNVQQYLTRTANGLTSLPAKAASPLLTDIISGLDGPETDERLMNNADIRLYFGHAETLLPLLSLMNLPGCNAPIESMIENDLDKTWRNYELAPLGGNVLIILAKAPDGQFYVTIRLNGRNVSPMRNSSRWVKWHDLRRYWINRMESL